MMTETVKYNHTDFDENPYDFFTFLKYKGKPFTGTLVDDYWTCSFKDGHAEGRYLQYFKNGQVAIDSIYEKGEYRSGRAWHPNGQLKSDDHHLYDVDGNLIRIGESWLYKNGVKRNTVKRDGNGPVEYYTLSSNGELAMKTIINMKGDFKNTIVFYDRVLTHCYQELLVNLYPDEDRLFYNLEYHIWGWVIKKYSIDQSTGMHLLKTLELHQNENIVRTAKILLKCIDNNELNPDRYLSGLGHHTLIE